MRKVGEVGMSKKSYKRNQNRLYREIKRRMIAEQAMMFPVPVHIEHRNFDTLAVRQLVDNMANPSDYTKYSEIIKRDMAYKLADKLMDEGYITYLTRENHYDPIFDKCEVEARIMVVRKEGR